MLRWLFVPTWNPTQYATFLDLRTRPSRDLAQRVDASPRRVIDLGCGPGNSTAVCAERWPDASIAGLDSSPEMIETARARFPNLEWRVADIRAWIDEDPEGRVDLIFSSAALQWVDDHAVVFPRLLRKLAPGGVLAVQMPDYDAAPNRVLREMAAAERWRKWFPDGRAKEWRSHPLEFYYAVLAGAAKRLDLWATEYLQVMPHGEAIVDWYKGTGLRPYLDRIDDAGELDNFLREYGERLTPLYPASEAGGVPFLFRRIFLVAAV